MGYCVLVRDLRAGIAACRNNTVKGRWRRRGRGTGVESFTLVELIIIIAMIGILSGIAVPLYADFVHRAKVERAKWEIRQFESVINIYYYKYNRYPSSLTDVAYGTPLDPWGNAYQYVSSEDPAWSGLARFDRNIRPLNSDYDLCSMGADGLTARNLAATKSLDDVIRAGNGSYVGLGADY